MAFYSGWMNGRTDGKRDGGEGKQGKEEKMEPCGRKMAATAAGGRQEERTEQRELHSWSTNGRSGFVEIA